MEYRTLNRTALTVSRAALGTMTFGSQVDAGVAARMVDCCLERGINFIDTANAYHGGESERILGEILGGRRSRTILASKVGMKVGTHPAGLSPGLILAAAEDSLRRLKTDYIDIYYLHTPDSNTPLEESLEAMECLVRQGKVRCVASSNYASWQVCRMLWIAEKSGYQPARIAQPMYNLLTRGIEDEFLPACSALGVSTVSYNPLAGGLLTGKHTMDGPLPGTRFAGNQSYVDRYWNRVNHGAVSRLSAIASAAGRSMVSLALNWLLHHTSIDCIILGASGLEQLQENIAALNDGALDEHSVAACDEVWKGVRGPSPKYNR